MAQDESSSAAGPLLTARNLRKVYSMGANISVTALAGVDLDVARGIFIAVMGPSGSGKSTLLNLLGCLDTPDEGHLVIDGLVIEHGAGVDLAAFRLRTIGFVFQRFNLLEHLTALENVALPLHYCRPRIAGPERDRRALDTLNRVGLSSRVDHRPDQLSGGEQQRVGIARAIVNEPKLILADEPTGELDTATGWQVIELLHELVRCRSSTVVIVTHDPEVAEGADRVIKLADGRIRP